MDHTYTSEHGESETKAASSKGTSVGRKSPKKERIVITPASRLRILQQAAYDCQESGLPTRIVVLNGSLAVVIDGAKLDEDGNIVPIPAENTANNANTKSEVST